MRKRAVFVLAVILIAAVTAYFLAGRKGEKDGVLRASGIVEGREFTLTSKVAGTIAEIPHEGDVVKEGQFVIRLEAEDVAALLGQAAAGVERAKADLAAAGAALENSRALVASSDADFKAAEAEAGKARVIADEQKREMERSNELFRNEFVSRAFLDQAVAASESAEASSQSALARLSAARARRDAAAAQVRAAQGQLDAAAARIKEAEAARAYQEARLGDTVIRSPADGTVVFTAFEKGEQAVPGTAILTIVDTGDLTVRVDLEETLVASIPLNAGATITAEGLAGKTFAGRVTEIGRHGEFATQRDVTRGRQDLRTFRLKIAITEPDRGLLKPGMTVFVDIPKKD